MPEDLDTTGIFEFDSPPVRSAVAWVPDGDKPASDATTVNDPLDDILLDAADAYAASLHAEREARIPKPRR